MNALFADSPRLKSKVKPLLQNMTFALCDESYDRPSIDAFGLKNFNDKDNSRRLLNKRKITLAKIVSDKELEEMKATTVFDVV